MQFLIWLSLSLVGLTVSASPVESIRSIHVRSERDIGATHDAPAIKKLLETIDPAVLQLHNTIKGLTAANVGTEMKTLNTEAHTVDTAEAFGLLNPVQATINTVNQTLQDIFSKKDIIKNSGQIPLFEEGIRSLKPGVLALANAIQSQLPESMKAKIPKDIPSVDKIGTLLDGLIDQTIAVMKGEQESITVPASLATLIPAKGAGGKIGPKQR